MHSILYSVLYGVIAYMCTAFFYGSKKANTLPGVAILAGLCIDPAYIGIIFGLIGHAIGVMIAKTLSKKNNKGDTQCQHGIKS